MDELQSRIQTIFQAVFPTLGSEDMQEASTETVAEWDSIALVTLTTLVEEEFEMEVELEALADLTSFVAIEAYVRSRDR